MRTWDPRGRYGSPRLGPGGRCTRRYCRWEWSSENGRQCRLRILLFAVARSCCCCSNYYCCNCHNHRSSNPPLSFSWTWDWKLIESSHWIQLDRRGHGSNYHSSCSCRIDHSCNCCYRVNHTVCRQWRWSRRLRFRHYCQICRRCDPLRNCRSGY